MNASWNDPATLLIGIGNSGRQDDGLGWALLDAIGSQPDLQAHCEYRYQLQIEDAELVSHFRRCIFIDASQSVLCHGFEYIDCQPALEFEFSTHKLSPESVLYLCQKLYHRSPTAKLLLIQGVSWDLEIGLTQFAQSNLENALSFFGIGRCLKSSC